MKNRTIAESKKLTEPNNPKSRTNNNIDKAKQLNNNRNNRLEIVGNKVKQKDTIPKETYRDIVIEPKAEYIGTRLIPHLLANSKNIPKLIYDIKSKSNNTSTVEMLRGAIASAYRLGINVRGGDPKPRCRKLCF